MKKFKVWYDNENNYIVYNEDIKNVISLYPNFRVEEDKDYSYMKYIEIIKNKCERCIDDKGNAILYKNTEVYKFVTSTGNVYIRLLKSVFYLDIVYYIRKDLDSFSDNVCWTVCKPKDIVDTFLQNTRQSNVDTISLNQFKQIKTKLFYNSNGKKMWFDNMGNFYWAFKWALPNKKKINDYNEFKDNKDAVLVKYFTTDYHNEQKWFSNIDNFHNWFNDTNKSKENINIPKYEILIQGYNLPNPNDRKCVQSLPYFDIMKEYELHTSIPTIVRTWCGLIDSKYSHYDEIQEIIINLYKFLDKKNKTNEEFTIKEWEKSITIYNDILKSNANIICQQVNMMGVMGAGLALSIKNKFPIVYEDYKYFYKNFRLGDVQTIKINDNMIICNCFSQKEYGYNKKYTDYEAVEKCLENIKISFPSSHIGIPYGYGCGLGGGDWNIIIQIIYKIFKNYEGMINIYRIDI